MNDTTTTTDREQELLAEAIPPVVSHPLLDDAFYTRSKELFGDERAFGMLEAAYLEAARYPDNIELAKVLLNCQHPYLYTDVGNGWDRTVTGCQHAVRLAVCAVAEGIGLKPLERRPMMTPPTCFECGARPTIAIKERGILYRYCDDHR